MDTNDPKISRTALRENRSTVAHDYVLWILVMAFAAHVLEEYRLHWVEWATSALGLHVDAVTFFLVNAAAMVIAIAAAIIGWRLPEVSLALPASLLTNALLFHILPTVAQGRFSPGTITAVVLYLPLCAWAYRCAWRDGILTGRVIAISSIVGGAIMFGIAGLVKFT
jgi:hypothetical protein